MGINTNRIITFVDPNNQKSLYDFEYGVQIPPQTTQSVSSGGTGGGDMYAAVYDTNGDGIVDKADLANRILWSGVQNKPSSVVADIDDAVSKRHEHTNSLILNQIEEPFTTVQKTKLDGLTNYIHPNYHPADIITQDENHRFITDNERTLWNSTSGDMQKSIYDSNNDGKVDSAEVADSVHWNGVSGKPVSTPSQIDNAVSLSHSHSNITILNQIEEPFTTVQKTKLDSLVNYTHPATHSAEMIVQDNMHRFVTDMQTSTWSAKQDALGFTPENVSNKGIANGYPSLDTNGKVPLSQLPNLTNTTIVNTIADRNALTDVYRVFVKDASSDPTVTTGGAEYIFDGMSWIKTSEIESMDLIQDWNNISNKPTSSSSAIDTAVTNSHIHTNKTTIDKFTESLGNIMFDGRVLGSGDMLKSVYDSNNDGVIDHASVADSIEWTGINNKPNIPTPFREVFILSAQNISDKYVDLSSEVIAPQNTILQPKNGHVQFYGDDFIVTTNSSAVLCRISWDGLELQNNINVGTKIQVLYFKK